MRNVSPLTATSSARKSIAHGARGALALGAIGLVSVGALTACSTGSEKDAAQSATDATTTSATIEQAAAESQGPAIPYTKTDGNLKITVHDLLKPGADILVSSACGESDAHAKLTTSLTDKAVDMTPAADMGQLIGSITAPEQIGPGPADGDHTLTVTCDSGLMGTITFNSAGNGDHASQQ